MTTITQVPQASEGEGLESILGGMMFEAIALACTFVLLFIVSRNKTVAGTPTVKKLDQGASSTPQSPMARRINVIISRGAAGASGRVIDTFLEMRNRDQASALLGACEELDVDPEEIFKQVSVAALRCRRLDLCSEIVAYMKQASVPRSLEFYESVMRMLASKKMYHESLQMFDELTNDGLVPRAVTYSCLINFALEAGELDRAISFFAKLEEVSEPSIRAYMTILRVHSKRGAVGAALALFRRMQERGAKVDGLVLNVLLSTCATAGDLKTSAALLEEFSGAGLLDVVSYNTVIKGCAIAGDFDRAFSLLNSMQNLEPNAITYNTLMDAAVRAQKPAMAWVVLQRMEASRCSPDKYTLSTLAKALAQQPSEEGVLSLSRLVRVVQADQRLQESLFSTLVEAAAATKQVELVQGVFAQMHSQNMWPSSKLYSAGIRGLAASGSPEASCSLLQEMVRNQLRPSQPVFTAVLDCCCAAQRLDKAVLAIELMGRIGPAPSACHYTQVINGWIGLKNSTEAVHIHQMMVRRLHTTGDVTLCIALTECCVQDGNFPGALQVLSCVDPNHLNAAARQSLSDVVARAGNSEFQATLAAMLGSGC
mmetsp:Transcript_28797/g.69161  ORF Transcript_28797/g.69161 Transcript_28797/m.69161 type:complete len:597 (+) Transcript_28797:159-1949(+)